MSRTNDALGLASRMLFSNVWLLSQGGRRVLVDSGHPLERFRCAGSLGAPECGGLTPLCRGGLTAFGPASA